MATSLPTTIPRFVGRASELQELRGLLQSDRPITLNSPGGSDKTRLALQLASEYSPLAQVPPLPPQQTTVERLGTTARTALGMASFERAWAAGAALERQAAIAAVVAETAPATALTGAPGFDLRIFALESVS